MTEQASVVYGRQAMDFYHTVRTIRYDKSCTPHKKIKNDVKIFKGVDYATRMNLYNLIFEMVILNVTVSASATIPIICQGISVRLPFFLMCRQFFSRQITLDPFLSRIVFARKLSFSFLKF